MFCPYVSLRSRRNSLGFDITQWASRRIKEVRIKVNSTSANPSQVLVQSLSLCYVSYRVCIEDQESGDVGS
jgi:hypothetical protein